MSNFDTTFNTVLKFEGGFVNCANDPGGVTNFGISLRWLKTLGATEYETFTSQDIQALTHESAGALYKKYWWDQYNFQKITDAEVATKIFVLIINVGAKECWRIVSRAIRSVNRVILQHPEDEENYIIALTTQNGDCASDTLFTAINQCNPGQILCALRSEAAAFYRILITEHGGFIKFIEGWLNRAYA